MSFYIVDAVLEWDRYKNPTKAVLVALCSCINEERYQASGDTEVWPGTKRLMLLTGCSHDTIGRCIKRLEQDGVVTILSKGVGDETAHYIIHVAHIPQSCFIRSYMERTHTTDDMRTTSVPHAGDPEGSRKVLGGMVDDTRKENNSKGTNGVTGYSPELTANNLEESRLSQGNGGIRGERTQVYADSPYVAAESVYRIRGERTGVGAESVPNKEQNNEPNMESKSKPTYNSPSARVPSAGLLSDPPEAELTRAAEEMLEFAKAHKFWSKFTRNPKSFRNGCLESESFQKQFQKFLKARKKTSTKVPSSPDFSAPDLDY